MGTNVGSRRIGAAKVQIAESTSPLALRPRDAAKALGISPRLLWDMTAPRGPIPCIRLGHGKRKTILYCVEDLQALLKAQATNEGGKQ
jgi:hypothetical protein